MVKRQHRFIIVVQRTCWNEIKNVDCAFTSPPYFSTERYNEGGEKQELQSWFKFNEYETWRDDFYLPVHKTLLIH